MEINVSTEYISHPIHVKYEASRNGTIRHRIRKIPIGVATNTGYLQISVYNNQKIKHYHSHRFIAEIFIGDIPHGFVIDHINRNKLDNRVTNLRIVTPRENSLNTNPNKNKNRIPRPVTAFYDSGNSKNFIVDFPSVYSAGKYFDINRGDIIRAADGIHLTLYSKKFIVWVSFAWRKKILTINIL